MIAPVLRKVRITGGHNKTEEHITGCISYEIHVQLKDSSRIDQLYRE